MLDSLHSEKYFSRMSTTVCRNSITNRGGTSWMRNSENRLQ